MKKASSGRNLDAKLEMMPIWKCCPLIYSFKLYICQNPRIARAYTAQKYKKKTHFSLASVSVYPRSRRCRTDKAERGALEPPTEDGARTTRFDREVPVRESYTEAETKKLLTEPKKQE